MYLSVKVRLHYCATLSLALGSCSKISAQVSSPTNPLERSSHRIWESSKPTHDIRNLLLIVTTDKIRGVGTNNDVYFDVGPWAWRLDNPGHNDFERDRTDAFPLKVPAGFTLSDIIWLRLQKKGLLGVNGTRDGFAGAWHPQRITLLVDGAEYASAEVTHALNSQCWFWTERRVVDPYADPASFARSLRLQPNEKLSWIAKATGFGTTPLFKRQGISGWLDCPEEKENLGFEQPCSRLPSLICATGEVLRSPAVSTDGLATIDLMLEALEFCSDTDTCSQRAELNDVQEPKRPRYLCVEYRHRENWVPKKRRTSSYLRKTALGHRSRGVVGNPTARFERRPSCAITSN